MADRQQGRAPRRGSRLGMEPVSRRRSVRARGYRRSSRSSHPNVSAPTREARPVTDPIVLVQKLAMLREHATRIRKRRPATVSAFEASLELQDAIALNVVV